MSTTSSPVAAARPSSDTPLSVQRPVLSPRKRKLSAIEAASPTSLDQEVTPPSSSRPSSGPCASTRTSAASHSASGPSLEARVISPKKKSKAEDRSSSSSNSRSNSHSHSSSAPSNKWERHAVTGVASALDLDAPETAEPISLWAEPAGDLSAAELELLCRFLA